ncbi:ATPase component of ABC transporter [Clostridiaceae bacterium JG1575]|nr:ATPase component of ABC transporter [Clostridiaceae bacterium JG1575]
MIALSCKDIKKEYGTDVVLRNISFAVNEGDKVALIGANGVGKTTLFRILTRSLVPDEGDYYVERGQTLGYLSQSLDLDSQDTIYEETLKVFAPLLQMEEDLRRLEADMATPWTPENERWHEDLINQYTTRSDLYAIRGGATFRGELHRVLTGLGLPEATWQKRISVLSGGEKTRVALAKLLLSNPSIILMDEPTNHLDLTATEWLEEYLKSYKGTLLVISHDRYFLDAVTNRTFLMLEGEVLTYNASYSGYLELHQKDYEVRLKAYEAQQDEIRRQEAIIERYRSFNREKSIRAAQSRQKRLEKMDRLCAPQKEGRAASIRFRTAYDSGNDVLQCVHLSKAFGEKTLFQDISFLIRRGEKIALIGDNGRGKTTLFHIIRGALAPDSGKAILGRNVSLGYYDQEQKNLSSEKTVLDEIWDDFPHLTVTEVRSVLGQYLFKGDEVYKRIGLLSGGERCRINLLKLMLQENNFLLLDEPTNHLDIPSREALEDSLMDYDGTIFVISHDRYFLNKVVGQIYELKETTIQSYLGNYSYYAEKRNPEEKTPAPTKGVSDAKKERLVKKRNQKEDRKARLRLKEVEGLIETQEALVQEFLELLNDAGLYQDPPRLAQVQEDLHASEKLLTQLMEEWEALLLETQDPETPAP